MGKKLTAKQHRLEEYLIDLNATQMAIRAGYSAKRADSGYENLRLKKPLVQPTRNAPNAPRSLPTRFYRSWRSSDSRT